MDSFDGRVQKVVVYAMELGKIKSYRVTVWVGYANLEIIFPAEVIERRISDPRAFLPDKFVQITTTQNICAHCGVADMKQPLGTDITFLHS